MLGQQKWEISFFHTKKFKLSRVNTYQPRNRVDDTCLSKIILSSSMLGQEPGFDHHSKSVQGWEQWHVGDKKGSKHHFIM